MFAIDGETYSHSIVLRRNITLFLRTFSQCAKQTTDISSVAHFRLPANVRGCLQKRAAHGVIDNKSYARSACIAPSD